MGFIPSLSEPLRTLLRTADSLPCSVTDPRVDRARRAPCAKRASRWCAQCQRRTPDVIAARCDILHGGGGFCAVCRAPLSSLGSLRRRLFPELSV